LWQKRFTEAKIGWADLVHLKGLGFDSADSMQARGFELPEGGMNTCHGAACWRARAYLKLREDGHTDTTYANDVLSADMTRPELVEALEQLPLPSSTCLLVIDRGVARIWSMHYRPILVAKLFRGLPDRMRGSKEQDI